jgi:hypothetical protein
VCGAQLQLAQVSVQMLALLQIGVFVKPPAAARSTAGSSVKFVRVSRQICSFLVLFLIASFLS